MQKRSRATFFEAEKFAKGLRELVDTLPTEQERNRIASELEVLIQFLTTLKSHLQSVPTQQDTLATRAAIDQLESLFVRAKTNPILASAFGIKSKLPRPKSPAITPEEIERANSAISKFDSLPIDQLRSSLETMSMRDLQAVAGAVGVRTSSRTTKEALVQHVATKITNTRGYRSLRDGTDRL
jgi:hypothetical protein